LPNPPKKASGRFLKKAPQKLLAASRRAGPQRFNPARSGPKVFLVTFFSKKVTSSSFPN
jgi:hypothetical protein